MISIVVESPLISTDFERCITYSRCCAMDCLRRGEFPIKGRTFGGDELCSLVGYYWDLGFTRATMEAMEFWLSRGARVEPRNLPRDLWERFCWELKQ